MTEISYERKERLAKELLDKYYQERLNDGSRDIMESMEDLHRYRITRRIIMYDHLSNDQDPESFVYGMKTKTLEGTIFSRGDVRTILLSAILSPVSDRFQVMEPVRSQSPTDSYLLGVGIVPPSDEIFLHNDKKLVSEERMFIIHIPESHCAISAANVINSNKLFRGMSYISGELDLVLAGFDKPSDILFSYIHRSGISFDEAIGKFGVFYYDKLKKLIGQEKAALDFIALDMVGAFNNASYRFAVTESQVREFLSRETENT